MRLERLASLEARVDDGGGVCAETDADVLHDEAAAGSGRGRPEDGPEVSGDKQTPHSYPLAPARCVVKEGDTKSRVKMCHMFFEDFLVRLATALQP